MAWEDVLRIVNAPLPEARRWTQGRLLRAVNAYVRDGFLPAYPAERACGICDYRVVCGAYEELRTARKPEGPAAPAALQRLREMP